MLLSNLQKKSYYLLLKWKSSICSPISIISKTKNQSNRRKLYKIIIFNNGGRIRGNLLFYMLKCENILLFTLSVNTILHRDSSNKRHWRYLLSRPVIIDCWSSGYTFCCISVIKDQLYSIQWLGSSLVCREDLLVTQHLVVIVHIHHPVSHLKLYPHHLLYNPTPLYFSASKH
jgi:hypothetical protein